LGGKADRNACCFPVVVPSMPGPGQPADRHTSPSRAVV